LGRVFRSGLEIRVAAPFAAATTATAAKLAALATTPFAAATAVAVLLILATVAAVRLTAVLFLRGLALVAGLHLRDGHLGLRGRRRHSLAHRLGGRWRCRRRLGKIHLLGRGLRGLLAAAGQAGARGLLGFGRAFAGSFVFVGFRRD
jgi:hypothetical protein